MRQCLIQGRIRYIRPSATSRNGNMPFGCGLISGAPDARLSSSRFPNGQPAYWYLGRDPARTRHGHHVGIDPELWRFTPRSIGAATGKARLLFVGGEFVRKGGAHLLEAFRKQLNSVPELHLVTKDAPPNMPDGVYVYSSMQPNDNDSLTCIAQPISSSCRQRPIFPLG